MNYKKTYVPHIGYTPICVPGKCSLKMLEFGMIELMKGDSVKLETGGNEMAFIILGGHADFAFDKTNWEFVGSRRSVFEGKATSVYIPRGKSLTVTGCDHVKIAVCGTKTDVDSEAEIIGPERVRSVTLGVQPWERDTHFIIDGHRL